MIQVALIPGDGIGPEVIAIAVDVLKAVGATLELPLKFDHYDLGADRYLKDGTTLPHGFVQHVTDTSDAILLGAMGDPRVPKGEHARGILLGLRQHLDLYLNLRPVKLLNTALCPIKNKTLDDVDLVVVRENTEGAYLGLGARGKVGSPGEFATETAYYSKAGVDRALKGAFELATKRGMGRVCLGDKHNAMEAGHGLWFERFQAIRQEHPTINATHRYADTLLLELITHPEDFDVIVAPNLIGDLVSEAGAALMGGLGLAPSMSIHPGRPGLFEPVHGSAPGIAGQNIANPMAAIWSAGLLLNHCGYPEGGALIEDALKHALDTGLTTPDLGGPHSATAVGAAIRQFVMGVQ